MGLHPRAACAGEEGPAAFCQLRISRRTSCLRDETDCPFLFIVDVAQILQLFLLDGARDLKNGAHVNNGQLHCILAFFRLVPWAS